MILWPGLTWAAEVAEAAHQADHALRAQISLHNVLRHHRLSHLTMLGGLQNHNHGCMYHSAHFARMDSQAHIMTCHPAAQVRLC